MGTKEQMRSKQRNGDPREMLLKFLIIEEKEESTTQASIDRPTGMK